MDPTGHYPNGSASSPSSDQTDHSYPYKNEVSLSIGDNQPATISPTPQPRIPNGKPTAEPPHVPLSTPSSHHKNHPTNSASTKDSAVLMRNGAHDDSRNAGMDNPAFDASADAKPAARPLSSFGQNGHSEAAKSQNGSSGVGTTNGSAANGSEKPLAEAVNLELVNLHKPTNGHENGLPHKKDTEVDIGDHYDEYFVPVNEHRKYMSVSFGKGLNNRGVDHWGHSLNDPMEGLVDYKNWTKTARGEKLYVTKDKRMIKSKWRKWLCYAIILALVGGALIIGILAAAGVILSSEPTPIEQRNFNNEPVQAAGIFGSGGSVASNNSEASNVAQPTLVVPPIPGNPENNMVYVPNTLEGQIKVVGHEFLVEYSDHDSPIYKRIAVELEEGIKASLVDDVGDNINVKVMNLTSGSIDVHYRVNWNDDILMPLTEETLDSTITTYLKKNSNYIGSYLVQPDKNTVKRLTDICRMDSESMGCEHGCRFEKDEVDFVCTCPDQLELMDDKKTCQEKRKVSTFNVYEVTPKPLAAEPDVSAEPEPVVEPEPSVEPAAEPEPNAEPEPISSDSYNAQDHHNHDQHNHDHHNHDHRNHDENDHDEHDDHYPQYTDHFGRGYHAIEPETTSEPASEPEPASKPEPEPNSQPEPASEPEPEPASKPEPEPASEPEPEPASEPEPEPASEPEPDSKPEPVSEPEPNNNPESEPASEPEPEPIVHQEYTYVIQNKTKDHDNRVKLGKELLLTDEHTTDPSAEPEPEPSAEPEPSSEPGPNVQAEPEPNAEPQPAVEPEPIVVNSKIPAAEPEPTSEPEPEPNSEPEPEPASEPEPEQVIEPKLLVTAEPSVEPKPYAEPEPGAQPEPVAEPKSVVVETVTQHDHRSVETTPEPEPASEPEPVSEPKQSVTLIDATVPAAEPVGEPEPTVIPEPSKEGISHDYSTNEIPTKSDDSTERQTSKSSYEVSSSTTEHESTEEKSGIVYVAAGEPSTTSSKFEERPAPVTEDLGDDTPLPTATYVKARRLDAVHTEHEVNVMDGTTTPRNDQTSPVVFYSTPTHILEKEPESSSNISPYLPHIESSTSKTTMYAVTENVYEIDTLPPHIHPSLDQSPFLPEGENNVTLLNILHAGHDVRLFDTQNETVDENVTLAREDFKVKKKKPRLDDDENHKHNPMDNDFHEDKVAVTASSPSHGLRVVPLHKVNVGLEAATEDQEMASTTFEPEQTTFIDDVNEDSTEILSDLDAEATTTFTAAERERNGNAATTMRSIDENLVTDSRIIRLNVTTSTSSSSTSTTTEVTPFTEHVDAEDSTTPAAASAAPTTTSDATNDIYDASEKYTKTGSLYENTYSRLTDNELKVVPLTKHITKKPDRLTDIAHETERPNVIEETNNESTTGHFLGEATFQSILNDSIETSKSLDTEGVVVALANDTIISSLSAKGNEKMYTAIMTTTTTEAATTSGVSAATSEATATEQTKRGKSDGNTFVLFSKCTAGQFECTNGTSIKDGTSCISLSERCDSIAHCSDNSDEAECERLGCPGHFQCHDGPCLARHLVCDKIAHCNDGSDEQQCVDWQCRFDEISCSADGRGPCIPSLWQCDGLDHCVNGADETNCPDNCKNNQFFCSLQRKCIPETWKCDGHVDCAEGEDERLCDCPLDRFKCNTGSCIPLGYVCDGHPQCPDLSDEWNCFSIDSVNIRLNESIANSTAATSEEQEILRIKRSDGQRMFVCGDGWTNDYSDLVCGKLGLAVTLGWSEIHLDPSATNMSYLRVVNYTDHNFLGNLRVVDGCAQGIVALRCQPYECGQTLSSLRIAGGSVAVESQWPSVGLAVSQNIQCTVNIIAPQWVLASYSCIIGKTEFFNARKEGIVWTLHIGSVQFNDSDDSHRVPVERVIAYPQAKFKHFLYSGNAVLLKLQKPLMFSGTVSSVCLSADSVASTRGGDQHCRTAGWGVQVPGDSHQPQYLSYLNTPIVPIQECNSTSQFAGTLADDSICTQHIGTAETTCYNDEGAPLMCRADKSGDWTLKGILSYHGNCGRRPQPVVYSGLSAEMLHWITSTVGNDLMIQH